MKQFTLNYLLNFGLLFSNIGFSAQDKKATGLYDAKDDVFIINNPNFKQNLVDSESVWIVEFYNSWCGHCIKFAPVWKSFASDLAGWWPVARVGAVDCANDENVDLCRNFDIQGFPTFRLFPPHSTTEDKGIKFQSQDTNKLEKFVLDAALNYSMSDTPRTWPKLKPLSEMHEIWDETRDDHHYVAFVYEEPGSYLGTQVILDTLQYKPLLVRRMLKGSVTKFGIMKFPSAFLINRDGTFTEIAKEDNSRAGIVTALKGLLTASQLETGNQYLKQKPGNSAANDGNDVNLEPGASSQKTRAAVYMRDLESTLHYSFRQEIALHRTIDGDQLSALQQFINILAKYFPGREEVCGFLEKVSSWLTTVGSEVSGDVWINTIDELQTVDNFLPDKIEWVGCAGSEPRFRGYPCGMWTLFHTLTVGAYQHVQNSPRDLPLDVLGAIQNYMKYFFGCETCVGHFLKMAGRITSADKSPKGAVMWLWRAHNMANKRLHGDESEDPKHWKIQFPSEEMCPECRTGALWHEDKVFEFLLKFYGKNGIIFSADDINEEPDGKSYNPAENDNKALDWWELQQRKKDLEKIRTLRERKNNRNKRKQENRLVKYSVIDSKNNKHSLGFGEQDIVGFQEKKGPGHLTSWGFSNLDMSMCILFYVTCTVMILVLYYHFIVRKKYRPCKFL